MLTLYAKETSRTLSVGNRTADSNLSDKHHIPSLDGIRAVAFGFVFLSHAVSSKIPGGFGVTIFFFLSGFLITRLLLVEHQTTGSINLRDFYVRRAFRIFPPMYMSLALMAAATSLGALPGTLHPKPMLAESLFFTNYYSHYNPSLAGAPKGSGILWSLAVEEHFYLIFPAFLLVLLRTQARPKVVLPILCLAVLAWRMFSYTQGLADENDIYVRSDTRIDSILYGSVLAVWFDEIKPQHRGAILSLATVTIVSTFLVRDAFFRATIRYSLQGIALLPVFYFAIRTPTWVVFRCLNWKVMAFAGTLTYSTYLVHLAIIEIINYCAPALNSTERAFVAAVVTVATAIGMRYLIELPSIAFRRRLSIKKGDATNETPA